MKFNYYNIHILMLSLMVCGGLQGNQAALRVNATVSRPFNQPLPLNLTKPPVLLPQTITSQAPLVQGQPSLFSRGYQYIHAIREHPYIAAISGGQLVLQLLGYYGQRVSAAKAVEDEANTRQTYLTTKNKENAYNLLTALAAKRENASPSLTHILYTFACQLALTQFDASALGALFLPFINACGVPCSPHTFSLVYSGLSLGLIAAPYLLKSPTLAQSYSYTTLNYLLHPVSGFAKSAAERFALWNFSDIVAYLQDNGYTNKPDNTQITNEQKTLYTKHLIKLTTTKVAQAKKTERDQLLDKEMSQTVITDRLKKTEEKMFQTMLTIMKSVTGINTERKKDALWEQFKNKLIVTEIELITTTLTTLKAETANIEAHLAEQARQISFVKEELTSTEIASNKTKGAFTELQKAFKNKQTAIYKALVATLGDHADKENAIKAYVKNMYQNLETINNPDTKLQPEEELKKLITPEENDESEEEDEESVE